MPYALELLLDPTTTAALQAVGSTLHDPMAMPDRRHPGLPHLSLLVAERVDLAQVAIACHAARGAWSDDIQLGPTAEFLAPAHVLYLQVSEVPWLRPLQRRIYWNLCPSAKGIWHHYTPEAWVPHVTLSQGAPVSRKRRRAVDAHCPLFPVTFTEFVLVEFDSAQRQELVRIPLPKLSGDAVAEEDATWQRFANDLAEGAYFEAHETLEDLWRIDHDPRLQSTIWVAAAFFHWSRGTLTGAQRPLGKLLRDDIHRPDPIIPQILEWAGALSKHLPCPGIAPTDRDALVQWARYRA